MRINRQKLSNGVKKKNLSEPNGSSSRRQWRICDIYSGKSKNFSIRAKRSFWHTDSRFSGLLKGGLTVLISVLVIYTIVQAGSLTPSAEPGSTMQSLTDIAGSGFVTATHSLKSLYDKINSLVADIWNKQTSELTTTGSVGKLITDNLDQSLSLTELNIRGADNDTLKILSDQIDGISGGLDSSIWTDTKAGYLDAAISSRSTLAQSDILSDATPFQGADIASTLSVLTGTYDASGVTANANGNIMEQLEFIQQNLGGYTYGSSNSDEVLTTAGGTYDATYLTPDNVRSGVHFGTGNGSQVGTYGGGGWTYGSDDASKVLTTADAAGTYDATNLASSTVKSGITFGVNETGAYPSADYPLPNASSTITDLAGDGTSITSSNGSVEWWQSDGTRQTAILDFPDLANVCSIDTSNNSAGTLTVNADYIAVGNTYCGTAGTLLKDLFNGTGQGFDGGSQANGGVDDYNNGGSPPTDRYSKGWTQCTSDNNYCGTGLASADAKDNSTGLIWSLPCNGVGCDSFSDAAPLTYTWDNSGGNNYSTVQNATSTASGLCTNGDHGESGWYLPSQKQLMQAYIDGSYGNLEASGVGRYYWSGTTNSWTTSYAWYTHLSHGYTNLTAKTTSRYVRCVRSAN